MKIKRYIKDRYSNADLPAFNKAKVKGSSLVMPLLSAVAMLCVIPTTLNAATVTEIEGNNLYTTPQFIGLFAFTGEFVTNIEASTGVSHASIAASGDGTVDWYAFSHGGGRLILDIDEGMPSVDLEIGLWDPAGNLVASNDDYLPIDLGSVHEFDAFIDISSIAASVYYIGIASYPASQASAFTIGGSGFTTQSYTLNISSGAIPEPSGLMLSLLASGLMLKRRRTK